MVSTYIARGVQKGTAGQKDGHISSLNSYRFDDHLSRLKYPVVTFNRLSH